MDILIVDDHQLFSAGLRVLIQELCPEAGISTAKSVMDALGQHKIFDLILLDLHLPDAEGFDGLDRLKAAYEATPIVVVSSEENTKQIHSCISRGAMGFLPKSSSAAELFKAMTCILRGETYLPTGCVPALKHQASDKFQAIRLSSRQHEVFLKLVQGKPNKVIARELGISDHTVKSHVMAVFTILGVSNRTEAVYRAAAAGISTTLD
jgi:two-component system, NarL family, nitrate/nitrite response regulator NarL